MRTIDADAGGLNMKQGQQLPVSKDPKLAQQQQHASDGWDSCSRAAARLYGTPEAWGRPDDTKKTLPEQWRLHQTNWRYFTALLPWIGPPMFTLRRIWWPFLSVMCMCLTIKLIEGKIAWQLDRSNYALTLYRTSQFMLSLLLAFRLNRTYERWHLARQAFGGIGGGLVNVVRQVATYTDDPVLMRACQKWCMCMVYGVVQLINNAPKVTDPRVQQLLDPEELALYTSTTKPAKLCGSMVSALVSSAGFQVEQEVMVNGMLSGVAANISQVARIKLQAMPFGMSLFCTGWTYIWLLVLPFGIFPEASFWALLPVAVMTAMMLGLEDLACQLEDPFKFIPYEPMVATTAKDMPRTVAEVQACKRMVKQKYTCTLHDAAACAQDMPPWPELKPRPQRA